MAIQLLNDIILIFFISIVTVFLGTKLKLPVVVGFLATGVIAGPHGLKLIQNVSQIESLAELGVILLLFVIGMEFSFERLFSIRKSTLVGGPLQVLITLLSVAFIGQEMGLPFQEAIFAGFLVSLSSTAIVLKLMQDRAEVDSPYGRTTLGFLIFQDIVVVPMMLFTPLLAADSIGGGGFSGPLIDMVVKGLGIIGLVILSAKWIVPRLLYQIVCLRSKELFPLAVLLICFSVAWLSYTAGLSLALGAFLAGLIISESEYSYQALGNILPFRDVFTSFFFVSIGMLLDVAFFLDRWVQIAAIVMLVVILKSVIAGTVTLLLGYPLRIGILVGFALAQIGEFSFILSKTGLDYGIIAQEDYQLFLAVSVLTLAATPFMMGISSGISEQANNFPLNKKFKPYQAFPQEKEIINNHVLIVGFGFVGRNLARAARVSDLPYLILEINPEVVRAEKAKGEPIYFGDATQEQVLHHVDVETARVLVIAISDDAATRRVTQMARELNPQIYIMARVRYLREAGLLYELGANEVIPEEFETSVEIFSRVLRKYLIPKNEISSLITETRSHGYEMFRGMETEPLKVSDLRHYIKDVDIVTIRVEIESHAAEKSLDQLKLKEKYGINVLAVIRDEDNIHNPHSDTIVHSDDVLLILGTTDQLLAVQDVFKKCDI